MLKIGIITASARDERLGDQVSKWILDYAESRNDEGVTYTAVDIKDFDLPFLGTKPTEAELATIKRWSETMAGFDGYVIVTPEYNRAVPGTFKNASDYLKPELENKVVGFVGYGGLGATRAIDSLRLISAEQQLASVKTTVNFLLAVDFENFKTFNPGPFHQTNAKAMFDQLLLWGKALQTVR